MTITTMSSRELNQNVTQAKKAALHGPVIITDRGRPAHVLLTIEEYRRLSGRTRSIADALHLRDSADVEFEPGRVAIEPAPVDFD